MVSGRACSPPASLSRAPAVFVNSVTQFKRKLAVRWSTEGEDVPGEYCLNVPTFVKESADFESGLVADLPLGTVVSVVQVLVHVDGRIRARIARPAGWISLVHPSTGQRLAVQLALQTEGSGELEFEIDGAEVWPTGSPRTKCAQLRHWPRLLCDDVALGSGSATDDALTGTYTMTLPTGQDVHGKLAEHGNVLGWSDGKVWHRSATTVSECEVFGQCPVNGLWRQVVGPETVSAGNGVGLLALDGLPEPQPSAVRCHRIQNGAAVDVIAYSQGDCEESWDCICGAAFLGHDWDLGPNGMSTGFESFRTSRAALESLRCGDANGSSEWLVSLTALRAKFRPGSPNAEALLRTQEAFLLEHNAGWPADALWSDGHPSGDGLNWGGLQRMLLRDELSGEAAIFWTRFARDTCKIDLTTGESACTCGTEQWLKAVRAATLALLEALEAFVQKQQSKVALRTLWDALEKSSKNTVQTASVSTFWPLSPCSRTRTSEAGDFSGDPAKISKSFARTRVRSGNNPGSCLWSLSPRTRKVDPEVTETNGRESQRCEPALPPAPSALAEDVQAFISSTLADNDRSAAIMYATLQPWSWS